MWLTRFSRLNSVALEGHAAGYGSTSSESAVLGALLLGGPVLNPSDLTKLVVQSPGGLTKTLRRLEDAGHIRRRPDPADRRALLVVLTEKGRRRRRTSRRRAAFVLRRAPCRLIGLGAFGAELAAAQGARSTGNRNRDDEKCLASSGHVTAAAHVRVAGWRRPPGRSGFSDRTAASWRPRGSGGRRGLGRTHGERSRSVGS